MTLHRSSQSQEELNNRNGKKPPFNRRVERFSRVLQVRANYASS